MDVPVSILSRQQRYYNTQITKDPNFRKSQLKKLYSLIKTYENEILTALQNDFRKSFFEGYATEVGLVLSELGLQIRKIHSWSSPIRAGGNLLDYRSTSNIYPEPLGQVLIISPWNYPFMLLMSPLASAISAGNTAVVKPSENAPATSAIIKKLLSENFPEELICCIEGGRDEAEALLKLKFDFIFFTGSAEVGRKIMEAAAKNLSRVCLELGGKNPCIIDKTASIDLACKRIVWGKFLNAGQTCVAPDYLLVDRRIASPVKEGLKKYILQFYGENQELSKDFPRIINLSHYNRLKKMIDTGKVFFGGFSNEKELYISPTVMENINVSDPVMQNEIFGPILPIIEYSESNEILEIINHFPKPLSFYLFSRNTSFHKEIIRISEAGNVNINDTVMQFANKNLPFGGKGESGMGSCHGKFGFDCFTHMKPVSKKTLLFDLPFRYPPYSKFKFGIIKRFLK